MLSKGFKHAGKATVPLTDLQLQTKRQIQEKVAKGIYSFEGVACAICGGDSLEHLSEETWGITCQVWQFLVEEPAHLYGYDARSITKEITGKRAGEKIYEELPTEDEAVNLSEAEGMLILTPAETRDSTSRSTRGYRSDRDAVFMAKQEIREVLESDKPQGL